MIFLEQSSKRREAVLVFYLLCLHLNCVKFVYYVTLGLLNYVICSDVDWSNGGHYITLQG